MRKTLHDAVVHNIYFWILSFVAISLVIAGFICPPLATIDGSVLIGTGELFAFAALGSVYKAIDNGGEASINKGDVSLNIKGKKEKKEE